MESMIVFSHLRWDFVYQRPQHLLSRLAERYRILFIEEPEFHHGEAETAFSNPIPRLTVCKLRTSMEVMGFHDTQLPYLRKMLRNVRAEYANPVVWFYTPMALPLLEDLDPRLVVYDCMDELSAFKNSPLQLVQREEELMRLADVVFTGGPSLYASKRHRHPEVHCFPSSVDVQHFRQALDRNTAHPSLRNIPRPRMGFYGVLDERLDSTLVNQVAKSRPEWQIVLVGPVAKIDPASLPRRENIHYLGQQPYSALPHFLAAWDVCLMPFAINESTRFISPTKSLEYMAAELPIVSTPIKDVVDLHSDVVDIAFNAEQFIHACERALMLPQEESMKKARVMRNKLAATSWTAMANRMNELLVLANAKRAATYQTIVRNAHTGANGGRASFHEV